ncbi:hypothetical protein CHU98_g9791 [Xylaria longipes]|nr:hypothetical protein CHU98_g9791 [Xylaria longipes]
MGIDEQPTSTSHPTTHSQPNPSSEVYRFDDEDEDEYGEGPITMMDDDDLSDGELTMVEPLSIVDDVPAKTQTHG